MRSIPSENFGKPQESGRTVGQSRSPRKKHLQTIGKTHEETVEITEIPEDIRRNRDASLHGSDRENFMTASEPPPKMSETLRKRMTLKIGADPSSKCIYWKRLRI